MWLMALLFAPAQASSVLVWSNDDFPNETELAGVDQWRTGYAADPWLGLETDAGRAGETRWAFFAEGAIYFSRFAGSQSLSDETVSGAEWSRFKYEPDSMLFQIGVGVRVYWGPWVPLG